jgi:hypothetical protein
MADGPSLVNGTHPTQIEPPTIEENSDVRWYPGIWDIAN